VAQIPGSGYLPKCHGSATLEYGFENKREPKLSIFAANIPFLALIPPSWDYDIGNPYLSLSPICSYAPLFPSAFFTRSFSIFEINGSILPKVEQLVKWWTAVPVPNTRVPTPPPLHERLAGKNHLNEEITPLLPTGTGERYCQTISNLGHAALALAPM
jgi:hypothetical protein